MVEIELLEDDDPDRGKQHHEKIQEKKGKKQLDGIRSPSRNPASAAAPASSAPKLASKSSKSSKRTGTAGKGGSITEQLDRAEATVRKNMAATYTLHKQWRMLLLNLSFLLILLTLYQASGPASECTSDIKKYNHHALSGPDEVAEVFDEQSAEGNRTPISGNKIPLIVLNHCMGNIFAIIMTALLAWFTIDLQRAWEETHEVSSGSVDSPVPRSFTSSPRYMLANACIPVILYFHFRRSDRTGSSQNQHESCISNYVENYEGYVGIAKAQQHEQSKSTGKNEFPVVLVYFIILSGCCWFMETQMKQQIGNVQTVCNLRKDLMEVQDKKKNQ